MISHRSVADEIGDPRRVRPHLALLGAGASRAALPNGDINGRRLPLLNDFAVVVPGVAQRLDSAGVAWRGKSFEDVFTGIAVDPQSITLRSHLERLVEDYFTLLILPDEPTIYDYLVLSLRNKDVIATFNWDPFLVQAVQRNNAKVPSLPHLLFLHGNVAVGYCERDNVLGNRGDSCSKCGEPFSPPRLLYPIAQKDYTSDPMIASSWRDMAAVMKDALFVTVFGYSAPKGDAAAIDLMATAWGQWEQRQFEEFEIIDIRPEAELRDEWDRFIHTHHYEVHSSFGDSWIANHPRRTVEAFHSQFILAQFIERNPLPPTPDFPTLWQWFAALSDAEHRAGVVA